MISDFFTSEFILLVPWIKSNTLIVAPIYSIDIYVSFAIEPNGGSVKKLYTGLYWFSPWTNRHAPIWLSIGGTNFRKISKHTWPESQVSNCSKDCVGDETVAAPSRIASWNVIHSDDPPTPYQHWSEVSCQLYILLHPTWDVNRNLCL